MRKKKTKEEDKTPLLDEEVSSEKKKKKKWVNPHKREFGIEIVKKKGVTSRNILHKISIDIGYVTSGLTHYDIKQKIVKSLYYKKDSEVLVKGAGIVYLTNLCKETLAKYREIVLHEIDEDELEFTQFILEEPLVIAGQKSFSISLYVLLHYLITKLLYDFNCHSVVLVRPGSAKKLLGVKSNVKMKDSYKTAWVKENLPEWETKNNHTADSNFSMILTNYDELSELYPNVKLLNKVDYKIYESYL